MTCLMRLTLAERNGGSCWPSSENALMQGVGQTRTAHVCLIQAQCWSCCFAAKRASEGGGREERGRREGEKGGKERWRGTSVRDMRAYL